MHDCSIERSPNENDDPMVGAGEHSNQFTSHGAVSPTETELADIVTVRCSVLHRLAVM